MSGCALGDFLEAGGGASLELRSWVRAGARHAVSSAVDGVRVTEVRAPRQRSEIERDKLAEDQNAGGH